MKKIIWLFSLGLFSTANAVIVPWWQRPTICQLDTTNCYSGMGAGYDTDVWDATSNCWGVRLICPEALLTPGNQPIPLSKAELLSGANINADYDVSVLNSDCFGVRKTINNGRMASVRGTYVNVWCPGVLDNPDETISVGEISYGTQPTCTDLANNGYVAILNNNKCYGKYYNPDDYLIECNDTQLLPSRIIVLNGADYTTSANTRYPADKTTAGTTFEKMYQISKVQHAKYFK